MEDIQIQRLLPGVHTKNLQQTLINKIIGNVKQFKIALFTRLNDGMHLLFKVEMHEKKTYRRNIIDKWSFGIIKYFRLDQEHVIMQCVYCILELINIFIFDQLTTHKC